MFITVDTKKTDDWLKARKSRRQDVLFYEYINSKVDVHGLYYAAVHVVVKTVG